MIMRFFAVSLCISMALTACHQSDDHPGPVDSSRKNNTAYAKNLTGDPVERLTSLIAKSDEDGVVNMLNEIKKTNPTELTKEKIQQLWNLRGIEDRDTQEFLMRPRVRLELANLLVQLGNNGRIDESVHPYVSYARNFVKSSDVDLANSAIFLLGLGGERADVEVFDGILRSENSKLFYSASLAISMNCFVSQEQFESTAAKIQMNDLKNHLRTTWKNYSSYRESRCQKAAENTNR